MTVSRPVSRAAHGASLLVALAVAAAPASAQDAAPRRWSVDDVLAMKQVGGVAISPDGRRVAYVVTVHDRGANVSNSDVWVVAAAGGAPVQVTDGPRADEAPQWAPDGNWLAFLSDRGEGGTAQVYRVDVSGGTARPLTKHATAIRAFVLSPDGRRLLFLAQAPVPEAEREPENERGRSAVRDSARANEWTRLWTLTLSDTAAADARLASPDGLDVTDAVWGPDARAVAFSARGTPLPRGSGSGSAAWVQSEPGAEARRLMDLPGDDRVVAWPNESGLIVATSGEAAGTGSERLWFAPLLGGAPVPLTDALDGGARFVALTARALLVEARDGAGAGLVRIPMAAGRPAGTPQRVSDAARYYSGFSATRAGDAVAFLAESGSEPPDVHASPVARFAPRRLTTVNPQDAESANATPRLAVHRGPTRD